MNSWGKGGKTGNDGSTKNREIAKSLLFRVRGLGAQNETSASKWGGKEGRIASSGIFWTWDLLWAPTETGISLPGQKKMGKDWSK